MVYPKGIGGVIMQFPGLSIGHTTKTKAGTGVTVMLLDKLTPCVALVLGAAPATYDIALLAPDALVGRVDALVFTGGSALGLDAIAGVKTWLLEQGRGFPTDICPIPIVSGAAIFDIHHNPPAYPSAHDAYIACQQAKRSDYLQGRVGAGTGATVGKMLSGTTSSPGGLGLATLSLTTGLQVFALAVVNAEMSLGTGEETRSATVTRLLAAPFVVWVDGGTSLSAGASGSLICGPGVPLEVATTGLAMEEALTGVVTTVKLLAGADWAVGAGWIVGTGWAAGAGGDVEPT